MKKDCVFCDRPQFAERLIDEKGIFNSIATLGQITNGGYTLLAPKEHIQCFAEVWLDRKIYHEIGAKILRIAVALGQEYSPKITMFEHGIVGQTVKHAHLHFLPASLDFAPKIRHDFQNSKIMILENFRELGELYAENPRPYLLWVSSFDQTLRVCWNPPAPPQYLRIVAAELLGRPERANWRTMDPELDKRLYSETVKLLKPYF